MGFMDLPLEVRALVYKLLFSGRRLRWQPTGSGQKSTTMPIAAAILLASQQAYNECKPTMLSTAQIDICAMIEHCQTYLTAPLFDTSIIRHIYYRCTCSTDGTRAMETLIKTSSNLLSVTFDYDADSVYEYNSNRGDTALENLQVDFIKYSPQRILGRDSEDEPEYAVGNDPDNQIVMPALMAAKLIQVWEDCKRSFVLQSQVEIYSNEDRIGVSSKVLVHGLLSHANISPDRILRPCNNGLHHYNDRCATDNSHFAVANATQASVGTPSP